MFGQKSLYTNTHQNAGFLADLYSSHLASRLCIDGRRCCIYRTRAGNCIFAFMSMVKAGNHDDQNPLLGELVNESCIAISLLFLPPSQVACIDAPGFLFHSILFLFDFHPFCHQLPLMQIVRQGAQSLSSLFPTISFVMTECLHDGPYGTQTCVIEREGKSVYAPLLCLSSFCLLHLPVSPDRDCFICKSACLSLPHPLCTFSPVSPSKTGMMMLMCECVDSPDSPLLL